MPSLKVPQKISTKKIHNLLIKVYRYHFIREWSADDKKKSTIVDVANTEKNLKKNKNVVLNKGWKYIKQMWNELLFVSLFQ